MGRRKGESRKTDNYSFQAKDPGIRELLDNQKNINESIRKILLHHLNKYGPGEVDEPAIQFQMLQEIYGGKVEQNIISVQPITPPKNRIENVAQEKVAQEEIKQEDPDILENNQVIEKENVEVKQIEGAEEQKIENAEVKKIEENTVEVDNEAKPVTRKNTPKFDRKKFKI
ncbi:hypothetical protein [Bacillus paramycoides]|uniref:hypothetical protein n=1 Tax=Bacillus paramycoides TaxID=2026194 RepID=UPI002E20384E|nr:hypothetical protein [Bacillus paramycoides]